MLNRSVETYISAQNQAANDVRFFDRGIPDTLSYWRLTGIPATRELEWAVRHYRYHSKVFILPPWEEIYQTDHERKQDFQEAVATFGILLKTYQELQYAVVEVPKMQVQERVNFVMQALSSDREMSLLLNRKRE